MDHNNQERQKELSWLSVFLKNSKFLDEKTSKYQGAWRRRWCWSGFWLLSVQDITALEQQWPCANETAGSDLA